MLLNHTTAFANATPVFNTAPSVTLGAATLVDTPQGWCRAEALQAGDRVATQDGGWTEVRTIHAAAPAALIHVPGGALNTCSDVVLPTTARVGLWVPDRWSAAPLVSAPLSALCGWRGIRPALFSATKFVNLEFAEEEMVYVQTGMLVHAAPQADSFYPLCDYGDARALLTLQHGQFGAPDCAAA